MAAAFNPYRAWLGVESRFSTPTHYELLGVAPAQANGEAIAEAFRRQMSRLNPHMAGEHGGAAQKVATELSNARVVLLTPTTKKAYDAELAARIKAKQTPASRLNARSRKQNRRPNRRPMTCCRLPPVRCRRLLRNRRPRSFNRPCQTRCLADRRCTNRRRRAWLLLTRRRRLPPATRRKPMASRTRRPIRRVEVRNRFRHIRTASLTRKLRSRFPFSKLIRRRRRQLSGGRLSCCRGASAGARRDPARS